MRFTTEEEAKKWLRGLPLLRQEMRMKIGFYRELMEDTKRMGIQNACRLAHYQAEVERAQALLEKNLALFELILEYLEPEERVIFTARYQKQVVWDMMEYYTNYSRRHAIRIHNRAVQRLIGIEFKGGTNYEPTKTDKKATGTKQIGRALVLR